MKMPFFALAGFLIWIGTAAQAQDQAPKQPKFLVIQEIQEDANYVLRAKNPDEVLKLELIDDYDYKSMKAVQERSAHCLQKIKQLTDSGTQSTEEMNVVTGKMTIGDLSDKMLDINRKATHIGMINRLEQKAMNAKTWVEDVAVKGKLSYAQIEVAKMSGEDLEKAVAEAKKLGFPDDYKITFQHHSYTLPELKEMGHYVATAGGQLTKEIDAKRFAKDQPYLKLLKGDRLRIFNEEFAGQDGMWAAFTSNGRPLTTPEAMNSAAVWYTWGNNRDIINTWHITGWRFEGDKLVGSASRNGLGLKPSPANFL